MTIKQSFQTLDKTFIVIGQDNDIAELSPNTDILNTDKILIIH